MGRLGRSVGVLVLSVFALCALALPAHAESLHGFAIDSVTGEPIEGLEIALDTEPERRTRTSFIGLFEFDDLPSGSYEITLSGMAYEPLQRSIEITGDATRERFELTPLLSADEIERSFRVAVHTSCTVSNWQLQDAQVRAERLSGEGGSVEESFDVLTDEHGNAYFPWMQPGVYRITAEKDGWEPVVVDDLSIQYPREVALYLEPAYGNLTVHIEGWDPRQGEEPVNSDLSDVTVELTGVHPVSHHPLVTPRTALTDADGKVEFHRLPPVSWKVRATKLGYEPVEEIIDAVALASSEVSLELPSGDTAIELDIVNPFPDSAELAEEMGAGGRDAPSPIRIVGAKGTGAEGVELTASPFDWDAGLPDEMVFEGLPPGRYEIYFGAAAGYETDTDAWNRPYHNQEVVAFSAFWSETVELGHGERATLQVKPELEPATIRANFRWSARHQAPTEMRRVNRSTFTS